MTSTRSNPGGALLAGCATSSSGSGCPGGILTMSQRAARHFPASSAEDLLPTNTAVRGR